MGESTRREAMVDARIRAKAFLAAVLVTVGGCGSLEFAPTDPSWTHDADRGPYEWRSGDVYVTSGGRGNVASGEFPLAGTVHAERGANASVTIRRIAAGPSPADAPMVIGVLHVYDGMPLNPDQQALESTAFDVQKDVYFSLRIDREVSRDEPVRLGDEANYVLEITTPSGVRVCPLRMKIIRGESNFEWWYPVFIPLAPILIPAFVVANAYTLIFHGRAFPH